jgi:hypothetical protein
VVAGLYAFNQLQQLDPVNVRMIFSDICSPTIPLKPSPSFNFLVFTKPNHFETYNLWRLTPKNILEFAKITPPCRIIPVYEDPLFKPRLISPYDVSIATKSAVRGHTERFCTTYKSKLYPLPVERQKEDRWVSVVYETFRMEGISPWGAAEAATLWGFEYKFVYL